MSKFEVNYKPTELRSPTREVSSKRNVKKMTPKHITSNCLKSVMKIGEQVML